MGPPAGGPEDREPPRVEAVNPPPGSTGVDPQTSIEFTFSEPVNPGSVGEALFVTPPPARKPRIRVRGRTARIRLPDHIPADRTLVVSLGTGVTDLHGNRLAESFAVALTAGDRIDQGRIAGMVFAPEPVQGILVGAWPVSDTLRIDPAEEPPEYLTQAGAEGAYLLEYMPSGSYRIACWDDRDRDRCYAPGTDRLGIPWRDVEIDADSSSWLALYLTRRDTAIARLLVVSAPDSRHLILRFSQTVELDPAEVVKTAAISDSSGQIGITEAWIDAADSARLVLYTDEQAGGVEYIFTLPPDTGRYTFTGRETPDTTGPKVSAYLPVDRARDQPEQPEGWIGFNDGLTESDLQVCIRLTANDTVSVPVETSWMGPNIVGWRAVELIKPGAVCSLSFDLLDLRDLSGNTSPDSSWEVGFTVIDPADMGTISGVVAGGETGVPVMAVARPLEGRRDRETSEPAKADGSFTIGRLRSGSYLVWAYEDSDQDRLYGFGRLSPFQFAERLTVCSDTVQVRERWETGGIRIEFR